MSMYSKRLQPALQNLLQRVVRFFHSRSSCTSMYLQTFQRTKITLKASDVAENLQLYRVVRFFHPRSSCMTTHISADVQRITLNVSCMTTSGGRTKQLDIFCCITGFTSDFLSFIVVELIRFFHGAIQLSSFALITSLTVIDLHLYLFYTFRDWREQQLDVLCWLHSISARGRWNKSW